MQAIDRLQSLLGRIERNAKLPRTKTQGLGAAAYLSSPATAPLAHAPAPAGSPAATPTTTVARAASAVAASPMAIAQRPQPQPMAASAFGAAAPAAPAARMPETISTPPDSLAGHFDIDVAVSPEPPAAKQKPMIELEAEDITIEDVSLEDMAGAELAASEPVIEDEPIEDIDVDEIAVEVTSEITSEAPSAVEATSAALAEPAAEIAEPAAEVAEPVAATPFTAPPTLDELTFSEPPPARSASEPPPRSAAHALSEPPDSIEASILAATEGRAASQPALTPPPESGPQVAVPPMAAPGVPTALGATKPTAEQLGEVIELEQVPGPPLELEAETKAASRPLEPKSEELEFVPPAPAPSRPAPSSPQAAAAAAAARESFGDAEEEPTASSALAPEVIARAPVTASRPVIDVIAAARTYRPQSFLELLEASIGLLKK